LTLISFDGKEIKKETFPVVIEPNKGILAFQKNIDYFVNEKNLNNTLLLVELKDSKSNLIANDILYFVKPMNLNLKKPNISKKINSKNGKYEIILKSDVLAKNVFLSLENADGTFSDNYFDILPGREVIVTIDNTKGNLDIEKELQIFDLTSSY